VRNKPTVTDMGKFTVSELYEYQTACVAALEEAKADLAEVTSAIKSRFAFAADELYHEAGKMHGTVNLGTGEGFKVQADVSRTVKYDSEKLKSIAATLPWEKVSKLFKITFEVPEKTYTALAAVDPDLYEKIEEARQVRYGDMKLTVTKVA
jgi:hypothetical protein